MVYTPGATETLAFQNFDGGNTGRYTLVLANGTDGQVTWQMFSELPTAAEVAQQHGLAAAPDGQALLVGDGIGLDRLTTVTGFTPGTADGCLAPEVQNGFNIPAGAGSVNYVSAPGAVQLAYYDALDSDCSQPPIVGPTAATLTAGERAYLLPFGGSKETLRLLVVPIPVLAGDPPLVALPTPTVTASVALPDACTLLSPDAVLAALGEPVTDTEGGADSGGCSWIGTHSSLGLGLQSDMDAATFAALMQGNGVTQSIDGLGDAAISCRTTPTASSCCTARPCSCLSSSGISTPARTMPARTPASCKAWPPASSRACHRETARSRGGVWHTSQRDLARLRVSGVHQRGVQRFVVARPGVASPSTHAQAIVALLVAASMARSVVSKPPRMSSSVTGCAHCAQ